MNKNLMKSALLVGVAGSNKAFSLSLYNLKAFCLNDPEIRHSWEMKVVQEPLVQLDNMEGKLEDMAQMICQNPPVLLAFSCYMWNIGFFKRLAQIIAERNQDIKIVFGGPEITTDYILEGKHNNTKAHYLVSGEGELTFLNLVQNLSNGKPLLSEIDGLSFRKKLTDEFSINRKRSPFPNLSLIPSPFLTGVVDDEVLLRKNIEANIETQRGCTLKCSYCVYHKDMSKISYSTVDRVLAEVKFIANKGVKRIRFVDANFSSDLVHAKGVMSKLIEEKIEAKIMFELIPGFIDEELAYLFHQYNNMYEWNDLTLGVGVQTINLDVLRLVKRGIKKELFEKTFELLLKYKVYAKIDLIIGLPTESMESINTTLEYMMNKLRNNHEHLLSCHLMRGLPGTELLDIARIHGLEFTSEFEPHELYQSPALPRKDLLKTLRRTAVIFRLVNHKGWAKKEFVQGKRFEDTKIHDAFFRAKDTLRLSNVGLVDLIVAALLKDLPKESYFCQDRFPYAETWWWNYSRVEISDHWLMEFFGSLFEKENTLVIGCA